jgi:hypothetical protein
MKFPSPAAAALAGAAQAPTATGTRHPGICIGDEPAPPTLATSALPRLCFRSAPAAPWRQLSAGDAVGSLN